MKINKSIGFFIVLALVCTLAYSAPQGSPFHIIFKGLNTKAGPLSLDNGESPDCLNVVSDIFGTLLKRSGYTKLNSAHNHVSTSPGKVNGLYDFAVDSSTRKFIGYFDSLLYKMDDLDGDFDPIQFATSMSNDIMEFENFDGVLVMTTWSRDTAQAWTGTGSVTSNVSNMPTGKFIIKAYNRLFVSDVTVSGTNYPLRFYFSNAGSYTVWSTSSDYETLDSSAGDRAMGWGLLKGRLFGFSKYSVNLISDVGGASPMEVSKRLDGTGCGAPRTIETVPTSIIGEAMIWLTPDKRLVMWNGSNMMDIGEKLSKSNNVCPFSLQSIDSSLLEYAHAQVDDVNGWYVIWIPIGTAVDYCVIYDYRANAFWPASNQNFHSSAKVETTTGNFLYVGETDGEVQRWNYGNTDDGEAINSYWTSRKWDFGFAPYMKKMGEVQIVTRTIGNYEISYQYRFNWDTSWSTAEQLSMVTAGDWLLGDALPITLGGHMAQVHRLSIPYAFNLFQIKLSVNASDPVW